MKCRNYAHRGASGNYPENTMLAFQKALEAGCEGIEFDVQLTRDGELVIIHDETVDRTSNGTGWVRDMTYEELCQLDFSYKWSGQLPFQKIPTLREYFELVKDLDIVSNIELKTGVYEYPGIEAAVYALIKEYGLEKKVVVSSFNHLSVLRMKALDPAIECGFLSEAWLLEAGSYVSRYGVEDFHPHFAMLTDTMVAELRAHNVGINTWTVNDPEDIRRMIHFKVDGIISNYPERVTRELQSAGLR